MKRTVPFAFLVLAGLAATAVSSYAGPLQRSDIAASPAWVAHVDWDALRNTSIGQFIQGELDKPEAQAKLAAFEAIVSIDLRTQLHGTTFYGTGTAPEDAVVLVYADFDPDRLVTLAKGAKDSQNSAYKSHTIYNWIDEKKEKSAHGGSPRIYAALAGKRVIFGQRGASVAQVLDVLDGATPNLSSTKTLPQFGIPGDASFIEAAVRKFQLPDSNPNATILRLTKEASLQISQVQQQVSAILILEANDEDVATSVSSIAQGLLALLKLQKEKPEAVKIADALTLKQDGPRVVAKLTLPGNDIVNAIKADAARKAAKREQKSEAENK